MIDFTAPNFPLSLASRAEELLWACNSELHEQGIQISLIGPRRAIVDVIDEYESVGLSPDLRKFGPYDGKKRPTEQLTVRQREVLTTAYEMGYYNVPRSAVTEEVAAKMDINAATVNEHLQRAERNLVSQCLPVD